MTDHSCLILYRRWIFLDTSLNQFLPDSYLSQKFESETQVGSLGQKSELEIQVGNPSQKPEPEISADKKPPNAKNKRGGKNTPKDNRRDFAAGITFRCGNYKMFRPGAAALVGNHAFFARRHRQAFC